MKSVKERINTPIAVFLVLIILLGVASWTALYLLTKQKSQEAAVSVPVDEMKDWKTYRNEKYGFEFKYPDDYKIFEETNRKTVLFFVGLGHLNIWVDVYNFNQAASTFGFEKQNNKWVSIGRQGLEGSAQEITVGKWHGLKGTALVGVDTKNETYGGLGEIYRAFLYDGDYLSAFFEMNPTISEENFDKILSTFKFIDPTTTVATLQNSFVTPALWSGTKWQEATSTKNEVFNIFYDNYDFEKDQKNWHQSFISPSGKLYKSKINLLTNTELWSVEREFRNYYEFESAFKSNSWLWEEKLESKQMSISSFSGDGATGGLRGYIKVLNNKLKLVGFSYKISNFTDKSDGGPVEIQCPCDLELLVFISDEIDLDDLKFAKTVPTTNYLTVLGSDSKSISIKDGDREVRKIDIKEIPSFDTDDVGDVSISQNIYLFSYPIYVANSHSMVYFSVYNYITAGNANANRALFLYDIIYDKLNLLVKEDFSVSFGRITSSDDGTYLVFSDGYHGGSCHNTLGLGVYDLKNKKEIGKIFLATSTIGMIEFDHWLNNNQFVYKEETFLNEEECKQNYSNDPHIILKTYSIPK